MRTDTEAIPLTRHSLPFEDVPFYGPRLLFDINFVTPRPRGHTDFD